MLEREPELLALRSFWGEALVGRGRLVFLGGEAGAGKTSVAYEFSQQVGGRARILLGRCDGGTMSRALGPLVDVAGELLVEEDLESLDVRRASLFPRVRTALGLTPTVLLLEDLHWADEATLHLVRYLARRMDGLPVVAIATFRDDEVTANHPLAVLMGELATVTTVTRMQLPLLTEMAVAELARSSGRDVDVAALHRNTNGNPFFVTEVLAAGTEQLPATVRDAVAARSAHLSVGARAVVDMAAVAGPLAEIDLVLETTAQAAESLDECVAAGMLLDRGTAVTFRHELARQAILEAVPPAARIEMHRRVLTRLEATGTRDHRRLAHHALACGDAAAVLLHAPRAAELAGRLGSHREAATHLRTALKHGHSLTPADRAELLERLSYECSITSQTVEAFDTRREAATLRRVAGDARRLGVDQRWLSRLSWFLGRKAEADRTAQMAVATLEPLGTGADLAMAYSNLSQLQMLDGADEEALTWGERALQAARAAGDRQVEAHALNNIGVALSSRDQAGGRALLERSLDIALSDGLEEHAARAWTNLAAVEATKQRLADAERTLRAGIAYCNERDLDTWTLFMTAELAIVLVDLGLSEDAASLATSILRHPHLPKISRIPVLLATARIAVRTGDPQATSQLRELDQLAADSTQAQHLLQLGILKAEAAWTAGRDAEIISLTQDEWSASVAGSEPWMVAELAWWRSRGGAEDQVPFELPDPFALMRDGRVREASHAWTAIGRPFWAALALAAGGPADTSEAVTGLLRLDAPASAQAVRRDLARRGLPVPRGRRAVTRANTAGLTAREVDVLRLLVEGLSDAEIAARLTLSQRTVGHHVSAILRKLDVPSRSRAAAAAETILKTVPPI